MKKEQSREEQIFEIDLKRNILFKEKDVIDNQLVKLHDKKEKLLTEIESEYVKDIPSDITKISKKQWSWILDTDEQKHSMFQYQYRSSILNKYGLSSFGNYTETKQPCICFHGYGFNAEKAKEIIKVLVKHLKPITVKGTHPEHGVCIQFTGLSADTTSVAYIHDDKTAIIYIEGEYDFKRFANINLLLDWYKVEVEIRNRD